ncbi:MAG: EAL domain-containing protein [Pseudomonadota bacterium]|nr:EAL domain-containing protein [Pseudomonadota bacterium]
MSLKKKMMIFIASMLLILLAGTFALNLSNTKNFLQDQLSSHAQDTATSLGLSLSSNADPEDIATMETMINAVFDRGYYANITLNDIDDKPLYQRETSNKMEAVPAWFIELINLQTPTADSVVQAGWMPLGTLSVTSHAGYAYIKLWQELIQLATWFAISAFLAIVLVAIALRIMLKPLQQLETQAKAIVNKRYIIQKNLPSTTEFKQVVGAMNVMVNKLKTVFEREAKAAEKLQKMAFQDSVTGLSNRRHFEMSVDSLLDPNLDASPGLIGLIRIQGLKELNDQYGYMIGDHLMKDIAELMQKNLGSPQALLARLNGTELVVIIPSVSKNHFESHLKLIAASTPDLLAIHKATSAPTNLAISFKEFKAGDSRGALLASLDYGIEQANQLGTNRVFFCQSSEQASPQIKLWNERIDEALQTNRFLLYQQSAFSVDGKVHDKEVLIRLKDENGHIHSAGYFMPAVEQIGKTAEIDKLVVKLAFNHLNNTHEAQPISINLTQSILLNESMQAWLKQALQTISYKNKLAFELAEHLISTTPDATWKLMNELKYSGVKIGIDHFGSRFRNMRYLQDLKPDYVKLDAAFSKGIEHDEQIRSYVESLCEMTSSLDIEVFAMAVENEAQQVAFENLGVKLFQGYLYGAPSPLNGR